MNGNGKNDRMLTKKSGHIIISGLLLVLLLVLPVLGGSGCREFWEVLGIEDRKNTQETGQKNNSNTNQSPSTEMKTPCCDYDFGQAAEMAWDAPGAASDSLSVLVLLGPKRLAQMLMTQNDQDIVGKAKQSQILLAMRRSGLKNQRIEAFLELYRHHPDPDVVEEARTQLLKLQKYAPWKVTLFAMLKDEEPALLGFLGGLGDSKATWREGTSLPVQLPPKKDQDRQENSSQENKDKNTQKDQKDQKVTQKDLGDLLQDPKAAVLTIVLKRILGREEVFFAQPEMRLNVKILAQHAPEEPIRALYPRLKSKLLWNRLTVALAEADRIELARDFSVPPSLVRIYSTAKALFGVDEALREINDPPEWAEKKISEAILRVSHLLAGFMTHDCIPEPKRREQELNRVTELLKKRLGEFIDALSKTVRSRGGANTEDVKRLFQNLRFIGSLSEAAVLSMALEETPRCEDKEEN